MKVVVFAWLAAILAVAVPTTNLTIFDKDAQSAEISFGASPPLVLEQELRPTFPQVTQDDLVATFPDSTYYPPNTDVARDPLCDGLGHCWRWGAWRNPDDSAWVAPQTVHLNSNTDPPYRAPVVTASAPQSCPPIISQTFGWPGCAISFCESGWDPYATGAQGEMGYFQVHPQFHYDATYDPAGNVAAAVRISNGGTNWGAWSVRSVLGSGVCPNGTLVPG